MSTEDQLANLRMRLQGRAMEIVSLLVGKERSYKGSWKKRGGVGAFMMLARKWDRIEAACNENGYNIFEVMFDDDRDEPIQQDMVDLIGYLLLCLVEETEDPEQVVMAFSECPNGPDCRIHPHNGECLSHS